MRTTTMLATVAALLALTACSSTDDKPAAADSTASTAAEPTTTPTPSEAAGLASAVQAYTAAYFEGDADAAYGALSERCRGKVTAEVYGAVVKQASTDYGSDHPATGVQADVSGNLARVTYKVDGLPKFDQQAQPWAREGGAWKYDAC